MVFANYPKLGITFLVSLSNALLGFKKYVMKSKRFLKYPRQGITQPLSNYGHKQYPFYSLDQNNSIHGVYKIPSWRYFFPF